MVEKGISLGKSSETNINSIRALATKFWVEHKAAIIKTAVFASTIPLALMAAQDVLAQANDLCYNLACEIGHGTWEQWMSVYKMDGWIVDSSGVLQAIGASQASCDPGDANFQMLEALGDSAESEQFFNINLAADPDVIDVCGVSPQPAELARVLEVNAGLAGQLPDPGIIPAVPTEAVLPEIPPGIASPDGVIPGVEPGAPPVDYDGYVLPVCVGIVISAGAIWGVAAGIGVLKNYSADIGLGEVDKPKTKIVPVEAKPDTENTGGDDIFSTWSDGDRQCWVDQQAGIVPPAEINIDVLLNLSSIKHSPGIKAGTLEWDRAADAKFAADHEAANTAAKIIAAREQW